MLDGVSVGSSVIIEWRCPKCSFQWKQKVSEFSKLQKCARCEQREKLLVNVAPSLEGEYSGKNTVPFAQLTKGSGRSVWWKCENGHEWEARVWTRVKGAGCPTCAVLNRERTVSVSVEEKQHSIDLDRKLAPPALPPPPPRRTSN